MRTNKPVAYAPSYTAEGAVAARITPELELRRSVMANMLFENSFYEDGVSIAERIQSLIPKVDPAVVAQIARDARTKMKLRHVPLLLARELARGTKEARLFVADLLEDIIQRPDELTEFLTLYWQNTLVLPDKKRTPLSAQVKKGLARAFIKFNQYSLSKYNQDNAVKLRDVMFLTHPNPRRSSSDFAGPNFSIFGRSAAELFYRKLADKKPIESPDTWEVALSSGADKRETFERLISEKKLGALALLRNLRNMKEAGVPDRVVTDALQTMKTERVLPFRFISAAKYATHLEPVLETTMFRSLTEYPKLTGKTVLIVDVSGSMGGLLSGKSEVDRTDAAASIAMLVREIAEDVSIYATAGNDWKREHATKLIPARRGFALRDTIREAKNVLGGGGIFLKQVMDYVYGFEKSGPVARTIVITDEQDCDLDPTKAPSKANTFGQENYLINIANEKNGVGYGKWLHIDGFSEAVIDFILAYESTQ